MAKTCSNCRAENPDDARFCRACGTTLTAATTPSAAPPTASAPTAPAPAARPPAATPTAVPRDADAPGVKCVECGFINKPGVGYCAKCGADLNVTVIMPSPRHPAATPPASSTVPPAATPAPSFDPLQVPDVPDPRLAVEVERERFGTTTPAGIGFLQAKEASPRRRTGVWAGLVVALLVAAGLAWWFLGSAPPPPQPP